jgi:hypothetical protein
MDAATGYSWAEQFVRVFVPLFVAIDAIGNLPFVISLSEGTLPRFVCNSWGYCPSGSLTEAYDDGPFH